MKEAPTTTKIRFNDLPSELVSEIFQRCLPDRPSFASSEAPLVLCQVCTAWRTIAINSPCLWSYITIPQWQEHPSDIGQLVQLWIDRSAGTTLHIDIDLFDQDIQMFPIQEELDVLYGLTRRILVSLGSHAARIQSFRGIFPEALIPEVCMEKMHNAERIFFCATLDEEAVVFDGFEEHEQEEEQEEHESEISLSKQLFNIGPPRDKLRSLAICGVAVDLGTVTSQRGLTHLELLDLRKGGDLSQESAFDILKNLKNLKTAILDLTGEGGPPFARGAERERLHSLETLFLTSTLPANISGLLDSIATPNLKKLGIRGTPRVDDDVAWSNLRDYLRVSKAPLERISLGDFGSVDFYLEDCLKYCPHLQHITINHSAIKDSVLHAMTRTGGDFGVELLPKLEVFNIGVCHNFTAENLVRFIASRAKDSPPGISKLQDVTIFYCYGIAQSDRATLESCGVENIVIEAVEDGTVGPYARVIETHRELVALCYDAQTEQ